jgi:polyisoprenoid-binding protein YceI
VDEGRFAAAHVAVREAALAVIRARMRLRTLALAVSLLAASAAHGATGWATDAARSRLGFTGTLSGGSFEGSFKRFEPEITFDPADLAGSRFRVTIETGSADTLDADRDTILKGAEFFAVDRWPVARFEAARFVAAGPGRYTAQGKLTLRDVTRDVTLSFIFEPAADPGTAVLEGGTTVRRLDFGVGQGEWQDTRWVGDEVTVRFSLFLRRK